MNKNTEVYQNEILMVNSFLSLSSVSRWPLVVDDLSLTNSRRASKKIVSEMAQTYKSRLLIRRPLRGFGELHFQQTPCVSISLMCVSNMSKA